MILVRIRRSSVFGQISPVVVYKLVKCSRWPAGDLFHPIGEDGLFLKSRQVVQHNHHQNQHDRDFFSPFGQKKGVGYFTGDDQLLDFMMGDNAAVLHPLHGQKQNMLDAARFCQVNERLKIFPDLSGGSGDEDFFHGWMSFNKNRLDTRLPTVIKA